MGKMTKVNQSPSDYGKNYTHTTKYGKIQNIHGKNDIHDPNTKQLW